MEKKAKEERHSVIFKDTPMNHHINAVKRES